MEKFKFKLKDKEHKEALEYFKIYEFHFGNEKSEKMMKLFLEIDKLKEKEQDQWIRNHHKDLYYYVDNEDLGYAFSDTLKIFAKDDHSLIFKNHFLYDGECEEYLKKVLLID